MVRRTARPSLRLTDDLTAYLTALAESSDAPVREALRARILLHYAQGLSIAAIVKALHVSRPTIYKCLDRALACGVMVGLEDHPHGPHESEISGQAKDWVLSLALTEPQALGLAFPRWSLTRLSSHVREHADRAGFPRLASVSKTTIWRILRKQTHLPVLRRLIQPRDDPGLGQKVHRVLVLSHDFQVGSAFDPALPDTPAQSLELTPSPSLQILGPPAHSPPDQAGGHAGPESNTLVPKTLCLLAGLDLHTGEIIALVEPRYRIREFLDLLRRLDAHYPDRHVIRLVLDTRSAHVSPETLAYLAKRPARFEYIHKPRHGSWLNLAESLFSRMAGPALAGIRGRTLAEIQNNVLEAVMAMNRRPAAERWEKSVFYLAQYVKGSKQ